MKNLLTKITKFCKIDVKGYVQIFNQNLTIPNKILLVLSARYLANRLQKKLGKESNIKEEITPTELADILKIKRPVIRARLKELKDDEKIVRVSKGTYKVYVHLIKQFLEQLEGK